MSSNTGKIEQTKVLDVSLQDHAAVTVSTSNVKNYIREVNFKRHHKHRRKRCCFLCKSQMNSLILILGVYVTIFFLASVILVSSVLNLQVSNEIEQYNNNHSQITKHEHVPQDLLNSKQMRSLFPERIYKEFKWLFKSSAFNCSNLSRVEKFKYLTSGWTKNVFSFEHSGKNYALKSVNNNGMDMKMCMEKENMKTCFEKSSLKLYKEYILSRELYHTNIIEVLALCVSTNNFSNEVVIITELCSPVDTISLLRLSFSNRLKIILDLSELLVYLANSPLGSVAINDFQRQQFVLCGNTLKLTDLDDLSINDPKCNVSHECSTKRLISFIESNETDAERRLQCINNVCVGYNEKQNVINAYKHFVNLFLNITTPDALLRNVEDVFQSYITTWDANVVFKATNELYSKFKALL